MIQYSDVIWASWHVKLPATGLFIQQRAQSKIKENIIVPKYWPCVRGIHQWPVDSILKGASNVEKVSMSSTLREIYSPIMGYFCPSYLSMSLLVLCQNRVTYENQQKRNKIWQASKKCLSKTSFHLLVWKYRHSYGVWHFASSDKATKMSFDGVSSKTHCGLVTPYMATHIWVNIGSGNGLLPGNAKPSPEPMLTANWL